MCKRKRQRQMDEENNQRRKETLQSLVSVFSGGKASNNPSTHVIRIVLEDSWTIGTVGECFVDLPVNADDQRSLQDLYDQQDVKDRVRRSFDGGKQVVQAITTAKTAELVLNYKNSKTGDLYCQYPVSSLSKYTIQSLIQSIPSNNNGPLDGAFAPITLYIGSRAIVAPVNGTFL